MSILIPTGILRFFRRRRAKRDGFLQDAFTEDHFREPVLQQQYTNRDSGKKEWLDIPTADESKEDYEQRLMQEAKGYS